MRRLRSWTSHALRLRQFTLGWGREGQEKCCHDLRSKRAKTRYNILRENMVYWRRFEPLLGEPTVDSGEIA